MRMIMSSLLALIVVVAAVVTYLHFRPPVLALEREAEIGADVPLGQIETVIAEGEAEAGSIRNGLAKQIVWADPTQEQKTPISVIYVHGFSASAAEVRPLPDLRRIHTALVRSAVSEDTEVLAVALDGIAVDGREGKARDNHCWVHRATPAEGFACETSPRISSRP